MPAANVTCTPPQNETSTRGGQDTKTRGAAVLTRIYASSQLAVTTVTQSHTVQRTGTGPYGHIQVDQTHGMTNPVRLLRTYHTHSPGGPVQADQTHHSLVLLLRPRPLGHDPLRILVVRVTCRLANGSHIRCERGC